MSLAGLLTEGVFQLAHLIPRERRDEIAVVHVGWNYTTVLNVLAVAAFGYLYWLYKNAARFGGGQGYAKDVVCGMQVRTADAPARVEHDGRTFHFCSDKCSAKFESAPDRYASGTAVEAMASAPASAVDPVCGMTVDPAAADSAVYAGRTYAFCSDGCRTAFLGDPLSHLETARDPVCGMDVSVASPGATATVDGMRYVFCARGCADAFAADPQRHLGETAGAGR
jgi:YHS domain-containing protein